MRRGGHRRNVIEMHDLFAETENLERVSAAAPLATRMRPRTLEEFVGQEHILGPGKLLRRAIEADRLPSLIISGPPGSGKTTLGSIISLIARPPLHVEHGTLEIDGQVQELGGHAKIPRTWRGAVVSMLPQGAMNSISPTKRIRQLVYDVMRSHESKISKEEALDRARDRLTTLGLPSRVLDAYPHQLSGGMKQRTVTIISTLLNPRLLVADEPTSALDVTSQKILIEMLLEMLEKRIMSGVIFVTHDLPVLRTAANRIAVMYQGKIVELGPTEIVVERPEHPYTQALMSSVLAPEPAYANTRIEGMSSFDRSLFDAPAVIHK